MVGIDAQGVTSKSAIIFTNDRTYGDLLLAADGTYSYTADAAAAEALAQGQTASDVFTYTVADAQGTTAAATLTFAVTGQNDAPTGSLAASYAATEQVPLDLKGTVAVPDRSRSVCAPASTARSRPPDRIIDLRHGWNRPRRAGRPMRSGRMRFACCCG